MRSLKITCFSLAKMLGLTSKKDFKSTRKAGVFLRLGGLSCSLQKTGKTMRSLTAQRAKSSRGGESISFAVRILRSSGRAKRRIPSGRS